MKITNAKIFIKSDDNLDGVKLKGCNVICDFPLRSEDYEPSNTFDFGSPFDGASDEFKSVFKGVQMSFCLVNGTDNETTRTYH